MSEHTYEQTQTPDGTEAAPPSGSIPNLNLQTLERTFKFPPFPFLLSLSKTLPFHSSAAIGSLGCLPFRDFDLQLEGCGIRNFTLKSSIGAVNAIGVVSEEFFCGHLIPIKKKHNVLGRP